MLQIQCADLDMDLSDWRPAVVMDMWMRRAVRGFAKLSLLR